MMFNYNFHKLLSKIYWLSSVVDMHHKFIKIFYVIIFYKKGLMMQIVTLKIEDSVSDKFLWLLNHFNRKEIEILENTTYQNDDEYLKSIQGMEQSIMQASNEPIENYVSRDELDC